MEKKKKQKIHHTKLFLVDNELSFMHYSSQGTGFFFVTINPRGTDFVGDIMVSFCIRRLYMENDVTNNPATR